MCTRTRGYGGRSTSPALLTAEASQVAEGAAMPSYSRTTTIAVDQDTAYAYLSKAENLPEYFPRITKVTTRGGDEVETTAVIEPPGEEKRTVHGTAWFKSRRQRAEGLVGFGGLERLPRRARLRPGRRRVLHGAAHPELRERPPRHRGVDRRDPRDDLEHADPDKGSSEKVDGPPTHPRRVGTGPDMIVSHDVDGVAGPSHALGPGVVRAVPAVPPQARRPHGRRRLAR